MATPIKIAMFSFADIDNYGDILFSHIFENEIKKRVPNVVIDFYTPSNCQIEDINYNGYTKEKIDGNYDALFLAGGEVVHLFDERTWDPIYKKRGLTVLSNKASNVVWDWVQLKATFKGWLSVGVRPFEDFWDPEKINSTLDNLDYISTRGILSKKILEDSQYVYYNKKIEITPDLGWLFPNLLKDKKVENKLANKFVDTSTPFAIFQFHNITDSDAATIANHLLAFKKLNAMNIYLLPVIHLWEDHKFMDKIASFSNGEIQVLPHNLKVLEIADIILNSKLVLCSSLHVAITALAGGIPAAIYNKWHGTKLQDLFGLQMRLNCLIDSIDDIPKVLDNLSKERKNNSHLIEYKNFMQSMLKITYDNLINKMQECIEK